MLKLDEKLKNSIYAFSVYINPNNQTKYLLFKGVGPIIDNKVEILHEYDYLTSPTNYQKLRNYYDMVELFGEKKCILVDVDGNVVSEKEYANQNEIAEEFDIKLSRIAKKAFSPKDVVGSKRMIKMANKK